MICPNPAVDKQPARIDGYQLINEMRIYTITNVYKKCLLTYFQLSVESTFEVEVAYYNEKLSVWEPLLEPVVEDGESNRWELGLKVCCGSLINPTHLFHTAIMCIICWVVKKQSCLNQILFTVIIS